MAAARRARRSRTSSRASGSSADVRREGRPRVFDVRRRVDGREPALAPDGRLAPIETSVDEDAGEPDLEGPGFAIRADVAEDLDEGVLDGFVGVGGVAEILIGDAQGAALMDGDELAEPFARRVGLAALQQLADFNRPAAYRR